MDHNQILNAISEGAATAGEFLAEKAILAKDYAIATKEVACLRRRINTLYKAVGKAMYRAHTTGAETAEEIELHIAELESLHAELRLKETERQAMRNRRLCPACDRPIEKNCSYCPHCGVEIKKVNQLG